jgi:hypothetical protein
MFFQSRDGRTYERADIGDYSVSVHHFGARHDAWPNMPLGSPTWSRRHGPPRSRCGRPYLRGTEYVVGATYALPVAIATLHDPAAGFLWPSGYSRPQSFRCPPSAASAPSWAPHC